MQVDTKKLKVIKPGILVRSESGVILDARSTVTWIQNDKDNILVDTSLKRDRELLIQVLNEQNLSPENITMIINTHCHRDHVENNKIFSNARIYAHITCDRLSNFIKIRTFPFILSQNIEIIYTPGHSWDSITVVVKLEKIYAITGDAIPIKSNYDNWIPPIVHVDANRALESMKQIVQIADIIIPGHDAPFEVKKI